MKVKIAKNAGFCFGVKRAMNLAWEEVKSNPNNIYALGPIIHNKQAIQKYEEKGLKTVDKIDKVNSDNYMIIRSHGVAEEIYKESKSRNINLVDTTCPFVKKIHKIVRDFNSKGNQIIVVGDKNHPEVIGINGWCENSAIIIKTLDDLKSIELDKSKDYCVVAQTTINIDLYNEIVKELSKQVNSVNLNNTICSATKERQEAAKIVSKEVDCMVVVGGKHSSNTQKLVQICMKYVPTFAIETKDELDIKELEKYNTVGVTAGASTPDWIIEEVINFLEKI